MEYQLIIIGFGVSGIATARYAEKNALNYIVLEKGDTFGGVWSKTEEYTNLQTHKMFYQFSELDHDNKTPDFPAKHHLLDYFNNYIEKYNLLKNVRFNEGVTKVKFSKEENRWSVETPNGQYTTEYLAICSGFFNNKRDIPEIPRDKYEKVNRKLVVGNGASATDYLKNIYNKGGMDNTQYDLIYRKDKYYCNFLTRNLPVSLTINPIYLKFFKEMPLPIFHHLFSIFFTFNKRVPDEKINYTNIIKNDFLYFLENNKKLNIFKKTIIIVDENKVIFSDGSSEYYDEIINNAGFTRGISFLEPPINDINLELGFNYALPKSTTSYPNLAFIGFAPSYNWIMVSEAQAKWFTECIKLNKFPNHNDITGFISNVNSTKNANQVFNDLTYSSLEFAKELGISNKKVDKILNIFSANNFYLICLISTMGLTLITLKNHPYLVTIIFILLISIYIKLVQTTKREKNIMIITGILFTIYGTLSESFVIKSTGVLTYSDTVKPDNRVINFPPFLPLVYFFWALIVTRINKTLDY